MGTLHACSASQSCPTLQPHGLQRARLLCPWSSPCKNARVGCHSLLQSIFPTQGSNSGLPHSRQILYCLSHQGSLDRPYPPTKHFLASDNSAEVEISCIDSTKRHKNMYLKWLYRWELIHIQHSETWITTVYLQYISVVFINYFIKNNCLTLLLILIVYWQNWIMLTI